MLHPGCREACSDPLCFKHILPFNKVFIFTKNYYYYFTCHLLVEQKTDVVLPGTKIFVSARTPLQQAGFLAL